MNITATKAGTDSQKSLEVIMSHNEFSRNPDINAAIKKLLELGLSPISAVRKHDKPLKANGTPLFTGKNPSHYDSFNQPKTINHSQFQDKQPKESNLTQWFSHPDMGVGSLGSKEYRWFDLDVKHFQPGCECSVAPTDKTKPPCDHQKSACESAFDRWVEKFPQVVGTWVEKTHSGGYRVLIHLTEPDESDDLTNYTIEGLDFPARAGEILGHGRFAVLAPTVGDFGNYQRISCGKPVSVRHLADLGIVPSKLSDKEPSQTKVSKSKTTSHKVSELSQLEIKGDVKPLTICNLVSEKVNQLHEGEGVIDDKSNALTVCVKEVYGWLNRASELGIPLEGHEEFIEGCYEAIYDGEKLDSSKIARVQKSITDLTWVAPGIEHHKGIEKVKEKLIRGFVTLNPAQSHLLDPASVFAIAMSVDVWQVRKLINSDELYFSFLSDVLFGEVDTDKPYGVCYTGQDELLGHHVNNVCEAVLDKFESLNRLYDCSEIISIGFNGFLRLTKPGLLTSFEALRQTSKKGYQFGFDEFSGCLHLKSKPVEEKTLIHEFTQEIGISMLKNLGGRDAYKEAIRAAGNARSFDSVRDWMESNWVSHSEDIEDCVTLLENLAQILFGIHPNPDQKIYQNEAWMKIITAIAARQYEPGHNFKRCGILYGGQDAGKSSALKRLTPCKEWFSNLRLSKEMLEGSDDRKFYMSLRKSILVEWAEFVGKNKASEESVKEMLAKESDVYCEMREGNPKSHPRRWVPIVTTNKRDILKDVTGNERYWIFELQKTREDPIDLDFIDSHKSMIWAGAAELYKRGINFMDLSDKSQATVMILREDFTDEHPIVEVLKDAIEIYGEDPITTDGLMGKIVSNDTSLKKIGKTGEALKNLVSKHMPGLGYISDQKKVKGVKFRYWRPI
jgi:uncharacterized Zn-finger protein